MAVLNYGEESVSVAMEEVKSKKSGTSSTRNRDTTRSISIANRWDGSSPLSGTKPNHRAAEPAAKRLCSCHAAGRERKHWNVQKTGRDMLDPTPVFVIRCVRLEPNNLHLAVILRIIVRWQHFASKF